MEALWQFPGATLVTFSDFGCNAAPVSAGKPFLAEWRGTKGTVYVHGDGYEVIPEKNAAVPSPGGNPLPEGRERRQGFRDSFEPQMEARQVEGRADTRFHIRNFLDCIKSREKPNCDVENGSPVLDDRHRRQHRLQDPAASGLGPHERAVYQQRGGQRVSALRVPQAVEVGVRRVARARGEDRRGRRSCPPEARATPRPHQHSSARAFAPVSIAWLGGPGSPRSPAVCRLVVRFASRASRLSLKLSEHHSRVHAAAPTQSG